MRLTKQGGGVDLGVSIYDATSGLFTAVQAPFYSTDDLASVDLIDTGDVYARYNATKAFIELRRHTGKAETSITSGTIPSTTSITADFTVEGVQFQPNASTLDALIIQMQSSSSLNTANVNVEKVGSNKIRFTKSDGKELNVVFASGFGALGFAVSDNSDSVWGDLSYEAKATQPTGTVADGTLWYNTDLKIEILKNTFDGTNMVWQRHAWSEDADGLLGIELQLRTGMPTTRKDGTSPLQAGDIWVDGDEMPYPCIYQYDGGKFVKLDNADQSSINGVVFGHYSNEAPYDANGNFVSRTAHANTPNAELYPENMLMVNMDYSTYNLSLIHI